MKLQSLVTYLFVLALTLTTATSVFSEEESAEDKAAREQALAKLKANLEGMSEDVFLREKTLENGVKFYQLIWEMDGDTSKITFELRRLGQFDGKPLFRLYAYSVVAEVDNGSLPPAVIKAVATNNERTGLGYFSMPDSFDTVYINMTAPCDEMTPGQVWMICAYMHQNRVAFKQEIATMLNASGR